MNAKIIGTGHAVPGLVIDNQEFEKFLDTSDEWIRERTCMEKRHIALNETALSLGTEAAMNALNMAGIEAGEIDILLCTTSTPDYVYPNMACLIQSEIGNSRAMCYDINAACSGFLYAASTAQAFIASGMAETVMVVSTEIESKTLDYADRGSCVLFGDGAAAVIFKASETGGILHTVFGADGSRGGCITMQAEPVKNHWTESMANSKTAGRECGFATGNEKKPEIPAHMQMDGKAVYSFATRTVPEVIHELLDKSGENIEGIDWFVLHQANGRMLEMIARKLGVSIEKVPMNLQKYGNTSSASIPLLLDEMVRDGKIKTGDKLVLSGFGAGLTWGALLMEW